MKTVFKLKCKEVNVILFSNVNLKLIFSYGLMQLIYIFHKVKDKDLNLLRQIFENFGCQTKFQNPNLLTLLIHLILFYLKRIAKLENFRELLLGLNMVS